MYGIQICWAEGLNDIVCYIDSMHTFHLLQQVNVSTHQYGNQIAIIKKYMVKDWEYQLCHTFRKEDMYSNYLAKLETMSTSDMLILLDPLRSFACCSRHIA